MSKKLKVYLAGGMEAAKNLGEGWRESITPLLKSLDMKVLNPCEFEPDQLKGLRPGRLPPYYTDIKTGNKVVPKFWHELKNAAEPFLYDRFLKYIRLIIKYDMNVVAKKTDLVIVYWDKAARRGAGTHAECTVAFLNHIPVYGISKTGMPAWLKGCCTQIFPHIGDLRGFLESNYFKGNYEARNK